MPRGLAERADSLFSSPNGYHSAMITPVQDKAQTARIREEWTAALSTLEQEITAWAETQGWRVHSQIQTVTEDATGTYAAPDMVIETPAGERLHVEVKGRGPAEAAGRVQLSAWPTLFRVMLLHRPEDETWVIRTDSGIPIRQPWNSETFVSIANDLLNAER